MDQKRTFLALGLSVAILIVWQILYLGPKQEEARQRAREKAAQQQAVQEQTAQQASGETTEPAGDPSSTTSTPPTLQSIDESIAAEPSPREIPEQEVIVETDLYRAVFSTRGARLKSFKLKEYTESIADDAPPVDLISEKIPPAQRPLQVRFGSDRPFSDDVPYTASRNELTLTGDDGPGAITFEWSGKTVALRKTYEFQAAAYPITLTVDIANKSPNRISGRTSLLWTTVYSEDSSRGGYYQSNNPILMTENGVVTQDPDDLEGEVLTEKGVEWAGFGDAYFTRLLIAVKTPLAISRSSLHNGSFLDQTLDYPPRDIDSGASISQQFRLYLGPKDYDILKAEGHGLEEAIDFGMLEVVVKPLMIILKKMHDVIPNYGVVIILLTVIIKILFYPLSHKSYQSMKGMQVLQPKMKELREKYKDDKEKLNMEMMNLYRQHKINPLGGCLPMILQIPVFIALYKVLYVSLDLRQAPFVLWIDDLSAPETLFTLPAVLPFIGGVPIGILPFIMGASMWFQQKLTPQMGDPMQQKMMMAMPIVFAAISFTFPSGLVLYWTVNNIISIAQQRMINRGGPAAQQS